MRVKAKKRCSVEGCDRESHGRGLCLMHLKRVLRTGKVGDSTPRSQNVGFCLVDSCEEKATHKGMCQRHWSVGYYKANKKKIRKYHKQYWDNKYKDQRQKQESERIRMLVLGVKICSKCGEEKPTGEFHNHSSHKDGKASWCAECAKNNENAWCKLHPEENRERCRERYWNNHEENSRKAKVWRENNKEKKSAADRKYREENPERCQRNAKLYYLDNTEEIKKRVSDYSKTEKGKLVRIKAHAKNRYGIDLRDRKAMSKAQDSRCAICGKEFDLSDLFTDHCHHSGIVRGLLCNRCNMGIGCLMDDEKIIEKALEYVRKYNFSFVHRKAS